MKIWIVAGLLFVLCLGVYWPHKNVEFVLDDYYTVVRNPLIKNPSLYKNIWTSRLFDAHQSSGYIKFGYYRPVLQSSWILDYRLFGLKAFGYKWMNLLVHALNGILIFILLRELFGQEWLALKASLLFAALPTQEWVVRYVTGRGDELSALFALVSLICFLWVLKTGLKRGYAFVFLFWALAALTREVSLSYILYAFLIYFTFPAEENEISRFSLSWILIGLLPILLIWSIIPKLGNVLALHVLYFASVGFCLWIARFPLRWGVLLLASFIAISCYQGHFWTTEKNLLRHTRTLEYWPRTVTAQQLLMKYDENLPAIQDLIARAPGPTIKAMWLRRLGVVYYNHGDLSHARQYFLQALTLNPADVDTLNALAVVYHDQGLEAQCLSCLNRALEINPSYPDTLRTLGLYYYVHKDFSQAQLYFSRCLIFDPDNSQARDLLGLANKTN